MSISPWSDKGWKEEQAPVKLSPCCKATIYTSRGDGVFMGTCSNCSCVVVRINPKTGKQEIPTEEKTA